MAKNGAGAFDVGSPVFASVALTQCGVLSTYLRVSPTVEMMNALEKYVGKNNVPANGTVSAIARPCSSLGVTVTASLIAHGHRHTIGFLSVDRNSQFFVGVIPRAKNVKTTGGIKQIMPRLDMVRGNPPDWTELVAAVAILCLSREVSGKHYQPHVIEVAMP